MVSFFFKTRTRVSKPDFSECETDSGLISDKKSFVVSFPRSGSNFLQACLRVQCGLSASSLYKPNHDFQNVNNLKSHAISPEYLRDEIGFICEHNFNPAHIYLLKRDPRDTMISFYEFFLSRDQGTVLQRDFLDIDWFLAFQRSSGPNAHLRSTHHFPLSICDAFKIMASKWFTDTNPIPDIPVAVIKYEDFVNDRRQTLLSILEDHGCSSTNLDYDAEVGLVSTYSNEKRKRGAAYGWKEDSVFQKYRTLVTETERLLENEIKLLDYE